MDSQTINGKVPTGVSRRAKRLNIPVIAICGAVEKGYEEVYKHGIDAVFDTVPYVLPLEEALQNASENIKSTSQNIARLLKL